MDDREARALIGAKIAQARKEHGLTQEDFAGLLGVTVRSLQNYESGTIVPYRHFRRMELVTNKRPGWFLHNDHADGLAAVHVMSALREQLRAHFELLEERLQVLNENVERLRELRETSRDARQRRVGAEAKTPPANGRPLDEADEPQATGEPDATPTVRPRKRR